MEVSKSRQADRLTIALSGRLDADSAPALEAVLAGGLDGVKELVLDLADLAYLSSAGLREILVAGKAMAARGSMRIVEASKEVMDIFSVTGFLNMFDITPALRQISIKGLPLIGRGVTGECYRVDDETLLKLYFEHVSPDMALREKAFAMAAFMAGVPTAISYDVVACGKRKGILYEMLNAETLSQVMVARPERLEHYVKLFADTCKEVHATTGDPTVFPRIKKTCLAAIKTVDFLDDAQRAPLLARVEEIPDPGTCVHGDLHTSNILMQGESPLLIDMGDFSIGHPMFDVAQVFNIFHSSRETGISERAVGMPPEMAFRVWELFEEYYFGAHDQADRRKVREEAAFFGSLRMFMFYDAFGKDQGMKKWIMERFMPLFA